MSAPLLFETDGPVARITLNRPERHNAKTPEMICRLADAFDRFEADEALRVVVITGAGTRSFCSGGDLELTLPLLSGARTPETEWDHRLMADRKTLFRSTLKGPVLAKPMIAAINGHCLAGGFELMLASDIRIAAETARFGLPEVRHALIPFAGTLARLQRQISYAAAMELLLTGDQVGAARALDWGLINRIVPQDKVLPAAMELAHRVASYGPMALAEIKRATAEAVGRPMKQGFDRESASMDRIMASADAREGPRAFMERRPPKYRGV